MRPYDVALIYAAYANGGKYKCLFQENDSQIQIIK